MTRPFEKLLPRMEELRDLQAVINLMTWDQETYLPKKAEPARAAQLSTLQGLYHERLTDPALADLLASAADEDDADRRAMVRALAWERDRAVKLPQALVRELAQTQSQAISAWKQAREQRSFAVFAGPLGRLLRIRREQADAYGHGGERYDALLEGFEPGMRVARLSPVLKALAQGLVPLVKALKAAPAPPDVLQGKRFPFDGQWRFSLRLLADMGFDLEAGRQDRSVHPFTGGLHACDVRLTNRVDEENPLSSIYGAIHEGGHGLYEQGFHPAHHRTPLAAAPSMGLHESQSRLWENLVGRSAGFWRHYFPLLRAEFPDALGDVSERAFYRTVNRVSPSLIRVEADEVTYNLHIILRFELELLLLRDALPLEDLPRAWDDRMEALLGVRPPHDGVGVLQDIHWAWGELGYFPTYSLGNLYAASLFKAAARELPTLDADLARGALLPLRDWLREKVHAQGYRYSAEELVTRVTGRGLTTTDFIDYLRGKYAEAYGLPL